jgi:DNA polymerase III epsilon subunit-like protein
MSEIVIFDLETTIPATDILEFGCITIDKCRFFEKSAYSTLVHSNKVTQRSEQCNGISQSMLLGAPKFADIADIVFQCTLFLSFRSHTNTYLVLVLNEKIWCGYNIISFDIPIIENHFRALGREVPKAAKVIDVFPLLTENFGRRAGDMKLATLGRYFCLGEEKHRSIADCRMTLDVLRNCALTLFLESKTGLDLRFGLLLRLLLLGSNYIKRLLCSRSAVVTTTAPPSVPSSPAAPPSVAAAASASTISIPSTPTKVDSTSFSTSFSTPHRASTTPLSASASPFTPSATATAADAKIVQALNDAMQNNASVWILYDNYENSYPRKITPTRWRNEPSMVYRICCVTID